MAKTVTMMLRHVPEELRKDLKVLAAQGGVSLNSLIVAMLSNRVEKTKKGE